MPGSGAIWISPWFPVPIHLASIAHGAADKSPPVDSTCSGGLLVERYDLALPAALQILSMPDGAHVETPVARYDRHYKLDWRHHLSVERRFVDLSDGPICTSAAVSAWRAALVPMWENLRQQLLYRQRWAGGADDGVDGGCAAAVGQVPSFAAVRFQAS